MKNIYLLTIFLCCYLYGLGQTCYTPTGVAHAGAECAIRALFAKQTKISIVPV